MRCLGECAHACCRPIPHFSCERTTHVRMHTHTQQLQASGREAPRAAHSPQSLSPLLILTSCSLLSPLAPPRLHLGGSQGLRLLPPAAAAAVAAVAASPAAAAAAAALAGKRAIDHAAVVAAAAPA